jgi:serine/threonine protein phosphatase 1
MLPAGRRLERREPAMVLKQLLDLLGPTPQPALPRIVLDHSPAVTYAIGDVHGCLDLLRELEALIIADAEGIAGERLIVMLGDLIDRGPDSAQVLDHVLSPPPPGFSRICLRGNHEAMMLAFLARPGYGASWLENGGCETLRSYGASPDLLHKGGRRPLEEFVETGIPPAHRAFLAGLPVLLETPDAVFVHAGMPRSEPLLSPRRIAIDTGAYITGRLTAVRLAPGDPPQLLEARTVSRHLSAAS